MQPSSPAPLIRTAFLPISSSAPLQEKSWHRRFLRSNGKANLKFQAYLLFRGVRLLRLMTTYQFYIAIILSGHYVYRLSYKAYGRLHLCCEDRVTTSINSREETKLNMSLITPQGKANWQRKGRSRFRSKRSQTAKLPLLYSRPYRAVQGEVPALK